ncbi:hypothetical protein OIDMADRAFT_170476 [Oidiodendron maius Zn]|uniref:MARVEL domain-containing protein n=1 Tax=Oidiodendron maius (strain Zn) TaxID=913774 RepID=A0A0C3CAG2_OIDMZ|nr:hypothetical protein OIDMADRAFT_170476 [Oidiodendron maius Zn]
MTTRDHVLQLPRFILILRFVQIVLALAVLGISAYAISNYAVDAEALLIYCAVSTLIVSTYAIVAEMRFPIIYNYWAIMALDAYESLMWLVGMALAADRIATVWKAIDDALHNFCYLGICSRATIDGIPISDSVNTGKNVKNATIAAAAFAGILMVLFVICLVFVVLGLMRHRAAGGHCTPGSSSYAGPRNISNERKDTYDPEPQYESVAAPQSHSQPLYQQPTQHYGGEPQYAPVQPPNPY